jgi:hypothetical protein
LGQTLTDDKKIDFAITESLINKMQLDSLRSGLIKRRKKSIIFEDSVYSVRSTCLGEWGGSIWFLNKKTGVEYSCSATCPIVVNYIDGNYFVTASLAHGYGTSELLKIANPNLMNVLELPNPSDLEENETTNPYVTDFESQSNEGSISIVDTVGLLTLLSFTYEDELYHITTNLESTFISNVRNGQFQIVDTVLNKSLWTYEPEVYNLNNGYKITFFTNDSLKGYIEIKADKINLKLLK